MAAVLYAEIYLLCIIIVALCLYWSTRRSSNSASERWLHRALIAFLVCFAANFCFTLVNRILAPGPLTRQLSWLFKSVFHWALCLGCFDWCGYADTESRGRLFSTRRSTLIAAIPLAAALGMLILNLWTHGVFEIGERGYVRHGLFHVEMGILTAMTGAFSLRLVRACRGETDPVKLEHLRLLISFPLCLGISWALSGYSEAVPVLCVAITIEMLCLFMSTSTQQISIDKLTQVNNRQNLLGFLEYKVRNHSDQLYLYMLDLDYFKTINDTYGHLEGDDALIRAAQALKIACGDFRRRPYIARYGGDEFIVVLESTEADARLLLQRIHESLAALNARDPKPYELAFSIGMAEHREGMSAKDLIQAADRALYEIKHARGGDRR
ncbi:MAG: GGDEF domain-containing protein [Clostridia bacterium]|nr:GGDEF domain-containing protein [Clostridia bacterium]